MHTVEELEAVGQVLSEVRRDLRGGGGVRRVQVSREVIVECSDEGFDLPDASIIRDAKPTKPLALMVGMIGRGEP
jgi:superfamily II DNA or RNA helicase